VTQVTTAKKPRKEMINVNTIVTGVPSIMFSAMVAVAEVGERPRGRPYGRGCG
jgi:hypothetical protein